MVITSFWGEEICAKINVYLPQQRLTTTWLTTPQRGFLFVFHSCPLKERKGVLAAGCCFETSIIWRLFNVSVLNAVFEPLLLKWRDAVAEYLTDDLFSQLEVRVNLHAYGPTIPTADDFGVFCLTSPFFLLMLNYTTPSGLVGVKPRWRPLAKDSPTPALWRPVTARRQGSDRMREFLVESCYSPNTLFSFTCTLQS